MIASLRNIPVLMWNAPADELVPPTSYLPTADELDGLGYRYELDIFQPARTRLQRAVPEAPDARDPRPVRAGGRVPRHREGGPQPGARHVRRRPEPRPPRPQARRRPRVLGLGREAARRAPGRARSTRSRTASASGDPRAERHQFGAGTLEGGNLGTLRSRARARPGASRRSGRRPNRIEVIATGIASAMIDVRRAKVGLRRRVEIESDGPIAIALRGLRPHRHRSSLPRHERKRRRKQDVRDRRRHDEVREAGLEGVGLPGHGRRRPATKALADAGIPYDDGRAGLRRLLLRRLDLRPARRLRARPDRHPGLQRQQQLLDRLDGAVPRAPGGRGRPRRLRARARLREDGEGLARREVHRPHEPDGQARRGDVRGARARAVAARAADVRQRRARAHGALRHEARALREDRLEEPQALGEQPVLAVPGRVLARGHQGARR